MRVDTKQKTVLVVDDNPTNIDVAMGVLTPHYFVQAATSGKMAQRVIEKKSPDLILLDVMMPEMDGYEVLQYVKGNPETADIPVIFLTGMSSEEDEERGLVLGASDYLAKPLSPPILLARISTHLTNFEAKRFLKHQSEILEEKVQLRTRELAKMQDVSMIALGALAESRDPETGNHLRRTQGYVEALAVHFKDHPQYREILTPENITLIAKSAPLHDIGKVGVADQILLKPGKLTVEEFDLMKQHPRYAKEALDAATSVLGADNFLHFAIEISYGHHEKWDGSGYPLGLAGEKIPLSARLMAIADVYDALVSARPYKRPMPHETAVRIITEGRGRHFDPLLVDGFIELESEFRAIAERYADQASNA